jgi:hypothetical protein
MLLLLVGTLASSSAQESKVSSASIRLFAGPSLLAPVTSAAGNPTLAHFGWGIGGGTELSIGRILALRLGASALWIKPSPVSAEGILYRGWDALRLSLAAGYSFPLGAFVLRASAGGALTAAAYSGTPLVFAYPSILAQADLDLPIFPDGAVRISLPVELMLRGTYTDVAPGLSASFVYGFPLGAQK